MSDKDILIIGFPRSGNTWLSRLLGDILDSPVMGYGSAHPLAEEGLDRKGKYIVRQLHLRPTATVGDSFIYNAWSVNPEKWAGEKVILLVRDPRDVAVSAMHYWEIDSLEKTINAMGQGLHPFLHLGSWQGFYELWERGLYTIHDIVPITDCPAADILYYEYLLSSPQVELEVLLESLCIKYSSSRVLPAIQRQAFATRKKELTGSGSKYMYGETIQLKNMRKGIEGDWKNCFTQSHAILAEKYFGEQMRKFSYCKTGWISEVKP